MCEPIWIATALTAASAYKASANAKDMAQYRSEVAANNASVADQQAADAKARGDVAAAETRRKYAALMGTQRAALAARGLDITDGSANATLQDTAYFGATDEITVRANAAREAWGYKVRATNFAGDAAAYQAQADAENPLLSAGLAGGQTLFGSANAVNAKWMRPAGSSLPWAGGDMPLSNMG